MTIEEAVKKLSSSNFKYLIMGYIHDGKRSIPVGYEMSIALANSDTIFDEIKKFVEVKVFTLSEEYNSKYWGIETQKHFAVKTEKEEKELLQKLKQKYEG